MNSKQVFFAAIMAFTELSSAHMIMKTPFPYGPDSLNNSPLAANGADYPCKQRPGVYGAAKQNNVMPVGQSQTLSFTGSAVHGGGSCQVSLTTDKAPSAQSKFKVIHSIIGGCPSNATDGNLPENQNGNSANTYTFAMPNDVPNGDYSLAWTWFNKIGNREMYMNCAPVTVSGSQGTTDTFGKLPDMFIANVGAPTSTVKDSTNVVFPNPGDSVETDSTQGNTPADCPPTSNGCTVPPSGAQQAAGAGAGGAQGAPAAPAAGAPAAGGGGSSSAAAPAPAPSASSAGAQGPAATPASGGSAPQGASTPAASPVAGGSGAVSSPAAGGAGGVPCSTPGAVVCLPNQQWGLCDITNTVVPQPLAQGTTCSNGQITKRSELRYSAPLLRPRHAHDGKHRHA